MKRNTKLFIVFLMIVSYSIVSYGSGSETLKYIGKGLLAILVAIMLWDAFRDDKGKGI
ncbi:hypothetical protein [Mesobacillus jeotgali]|uniref:hypothetical protein n=1 Tax=Mesobacillus jeotgali TaxID=129985 RepID=UPI00131588DC|nr:hypothetical protein [Mesobacillus jeotgali]